MRNKLIAKIINSALAGGEGHVPSALSILDIVNSLYEKIMNLDLIKKQSKHRDFFILSKGHGCMALYVVLEKFKLIKKNDLDNFCSFNGILGGHPDSTKNKYIEASTGSLGHGLPISVGISFAKKKLNYSGSVYSLVGDGECNEGSIWESAMLASFYKLNNLKCIVDHNKSTNRALNIDSIYKKFLSFNWEAKIIDGHNKKEIISALKMKTTKPLAIIANTTKGKGINFMEQNPEWHHKKIDISIRDKIIKKIKLK